MMPERPDSIFTHTELSHWAKNEGVLADLPRWTAEAREWEQDVWLNLLEDKLCAGTQLSSSSFEGFSDVKDRRMLRRLHLARFVSGRLEDIGDSIAVYGATTGSIGLAEIGFGLSAAARVSNAYLENRAGSQVKMQIEDVFASIAHNKRAKDALGAILDSLGYSRTLFDDAGNNGYMTELEQIWDSLVRSAVKPVMIGSSMAAAGNPTGWIVSVLGSAAIPIGNWAHRYDLNEKRPASRWSSAVAVRKFTEVMRGAHIRMVMGLRTVSEIPSLANIYIMSQSGRLGEGAIGAFLGVTRGLESLSGTLSLQRSRATQTETVLAVSRFLQFLQSPQSPIITPFNREEHERNSGLPGIEHKYEGHPDGAYLHALKPNYGLFPADGITAAFRSGTITRIVGDSGTGKTNLVESVSGLFNHTGDLVFVENGIPENAHAIADLRMKTSCISVSRENLAATGVRVFDYFNEFYRIRAGDMHDDIENASTKELLDLLFSIDQSDRDILLRSSYDQLTKNTSNRFAPKHVRETIQQFIDLKTASINYFLSVYFPRHDASAVSVFTELSAGMKQRVINSITRAYLSHFNPRVLILDEMVEGLDDNNVNFVLDDLNTMLSRKMHPPAVLYIAHNRNDRFSAVFGARYREFDPQSGLYIEDKQTKIRTALLEGYENTYYDPSEMRILSESIGQAKQFIELFSAFDGDAQTRFLDHISRWLESKSGIMTEWSQFVTWVCAACGFTVSTGDILTVLSQEFPDGIAMNGTSVTEWSRSLVVSSWLNLPLHFWLTTDDIGQVFRPLSPGDAIRLHGDLYAHWEKMAGYPGHRLEYGWIDAIMLNALNDFVYGYMSSPETYWPVYKKILEQLERSLSKDDNLLLDRWFGFYITAALRERGTAFIDDLDRIIRSRYIVNDRAVPRTLTVLDHITSPLLALSR